MSRFEFEYDVPIVNGEQLYKLSPHHIRKKRYCIGKWEIDVFQDDNDGLILAEIELSSENETFVIPDWVGQEVTDDNRFFNSKLAVYPFKRWTTDK